jgi:hypothetical protein
VATWKNEERSGFRMARVEMDAQRQQASERRLTGFSDDDAISDSVFPVAVEENRKNSILMNGNGPVGSALLVEIGGIDWERAGSEKPCGKRVDANRVQHKTELWNRG